MSRKIQSRFFVFDETTFPAKLNTETLVLKIIGFANIIIVGFDLAVFKVGDIAIGVLNLSYFVKATLWLKTHSDSNGR